MEGDSLNENRNQTMKQHPLLQTSPKKGGGGAAITMPFIIANATLEKVACYGLIPNMTLYLKNQYGFGMTITSNIIFYWMAAINFTPVVGAVLADSYFGRYNIIGFGSVLSFLGTFLLWLTTMVPGLSPLSCHESGNYHCSSSATSSQLLLLCTSLGLIAAGGGGIRSSSLAFGIDQLLSTNAEHDEQQKNDGFSVEKFYGWFYATYILSILTGNTLIVFIQEKMGWQIGFGVSVALMFLSTISFFLGSPFYVKVKAKPNLITELIQVIVASFKKRKMQDVNMVYHCRKDSSSALYFPTQKFRFLNKACVLEQEAKQELTADGKARDPWRLCTVDQVEDLKSLLKVIPMWSTGVIAFVNLSQGSFSVLQAESMNRKITANFEIPAGSFGTFSLACLALWIPLYDQVILPIVSRIKGKHTEFSTKQRIGAGIFVSFITVVVTALVEGIRRSHGQVSSSMSALWLLPQYCLMGIMEALVVIPQSEFYMTEFPSSMWSIASSLCSVEISVANVLASFLMTTIDEVTKRGGRRQESWVSSNLNKGHFDYYFWALSGLSLLNFLYFLFCCWTYGPCKGEQKKNSSRDDEAEHLLVSINTN